MLARHAVLSFTSSTVLHQHDFCSPCPAAPGAAKLTFRLTLLPGTHPLIPKFRQWKGTGAYLPNGSSGFVELDVTAAVNSAISEGESMLSLGLYARTSEDHGYCWRRAATANWHGLCNITPSW